MAKSISSDSGARLWTRDFLLNLLTAHFLFASYTSLFTIIPPFVIDRGGQEWQIGIVVGTFGIAGLLFRPFAGRWTYVLGAKRVAFAGCVIFGLASILYIAAPSVWWIVPVRILQGIGLAIGPVATSTMLANLASARRRGEAMAYMGNAIAIATVYSPVLGSWLLSSIGFPASFAYSAAASFLGAIMAFSISSRRTQITETQTASNEKVPLISRAALFPTLIFLTYTFTTAPINTFLPLLAEERSLGNPGLYFTVFSLSTILAMLFSGRISDKMGRPAVITPGLVLTAASMFLLMAASNQMMFLGAAFIVGIGFGLLQPGTQSLTVDRVPPRERGSAMATLQQAWDVGGFGGAFIIGPIAGAASVAATFGVVGVGALVGAAGFVIGNARSPAVLPTSQASPAGDDD